jgi:hypothetical protein
MKSKSRVMSGCGSANSTRLSVSTRNTRDSQYWGKKNGYNYDHTRYQA